MNLLGVLKIRMIYCYVFKCENDTTFLGKIFLFVLRMFAGIKIAGERTLDATKINIAIIGTGRVGISLVKELLSNADSAYTPRCLVDVSKEKVGRDIHGIPVSLENEAMLEQLKLLDIQKVAFAIPNLVDDKKKSLYEHYQKAGYKIKAYDYSKMQTAGGKRHLREFDIEELLFRRPIVVNGEQTSEYYRNKVILITGGGDSIGSELYRYLAKMQPKQIIILDTYENSTYDVQKEQKIAYAVKLDVHIEIMSITHMKALGKIFRTYRPQIVINAATHKHVPLMEHNCVEAVQNNIFGTKNMIDCCEKYGAERFIMVFTDKAVNPTKVMRTTKRICEILVKVLAHMEKLNTVLPDLEMFWVQQVL